MSMEEVAQANLEKLATRRQAEADTWERDEARRLARLYRKDWDTNGNGVIDDAAELAAYAEQAVLALPDGRRYAVSADLASREIDLRFSAHEAELARWQGLAMSHETAARAMEHQRDEALGRCRDAAQILIERIGAPGPESVDATARRAVAVIDAAELAAYAEQAAHRDVFEEFELLAARFERETGLLAPGKDAPPGYHAEPWERYERWGEWVKADSSRVEPLADALRERYDQTNANNEPNGGVMIWSDAADDVGALLRELARWQGLAMSHETAARAMERERDVYCADAQRYLGLLGEAREERDEALAELDEAEATCGRFDDYVRELEPRLAKAERERDEARRWAENLLNQTNKIATPPWAVDAGGASQCVRVRGGEVSDE
jgi:hypothetical protein